MYNAHDSWSQLDDYMCATWISGTTPRSVVEAFNACVDELACSDTVTVREEAEAIFSLEPGDPRLLIRQHNGWIIVLEMRSGRGADDAALAALSQHGPALNITAGECGVRFTYARHGAIMQAFDAEDLAEDDLADGPDVRQAHQWTQTFGVTPQEWTEHHKAAAFSLAEAVTGTQMDDSWVTDGWTAVRLLPERRPVAHASVALPYADMRQLAERNLSIRAFVENPNPGQIPAMKHMLAQIAVTTAGLSHPLVEESLMALADRPEPERVHRLRTELKALAEDFFQQGWGGPWPAGTTRETEPAVDVLYRRRNATLAVEAALNDDDRSSSYTECAHNTRCVRLNGEEYLTLETLNIVYKHLRKMID